MRVALFTETFLPKIDGIVTVVCLLIDHLEKRGIQTAVVAPNRGLAHYKNTPIIRATAVPVPIYPELSFGLPMLGSYRQLKAFQPDVAHVVHPFMVGVPGMVMARALDLPILTSFHLDVARLTKHFHIGFFGPILMALTRIVFNASDYSLAPSRLLQNELTAIGFQRMGLWKRGVDPQRFDPRFRSADMRAALSDGHPDDTLLLYVGRLSSEKQIEQIKPVLAAVPGTRLALVGDGPAREKLQAHFAGTNTKFMGYMTGEPLSQAYASADMFVFPSALESFGLVAVEAMAAGLPVVASRVGGIPDVVAEGRTGYTFDVGDISGMISGVRQIAASRARITEMGLAARAFAETQTWDAMMDEVIDIYARLIDERKRARA